MRLLSKPRMNSVPPAEPNGSLLVKLTPGSWLITSLIDWPGVWRWMNSAVELLAGLRCVGSDDAADRGVARAGDDDGVVAVLEIGGAGRLGEGDARHDESGGGAKECDLLHDV